MRQSRTSLGGSVRSLLGMEAGGAAFGGSAPLESPGEGEVSSSSDRHHIVTQGVAGANRGMTSGVGALAEGGTSAAALMMLRLKSGRSGRFSETGVSPSAPGPSRPSTSHHRRERFSVSGCSATAPASEASDWSGDDAGPFDACSDGSSFLVGVGPQVAGGGGTSFIRSSPGLDRLNTISRIKERVAASSLASPLASSSSGFRTAPGTPTNRGMGGGGAGSAAAAFHGLLHRDGMSLPGSRCGCIALSRDVQRC